MAYARFSHSDVYVYAHVGGHLECCGCRLGDQWEFHSTDDMIAHLDAHRAAGHSVPPGIDDALREDDDDNFVNYKRCDVGGCDKAAGCGSPTADGRYVSACSIAHAQTLGGFADWPQMKDA